jgi:hypothetical protein
MSRPANKTDLERQAEDNFAKLLELVEEKEAE